jgi:hypothetical protein
MRAGADPECPDGSMGRLASERSRAMPDEQGLRLLTPVTDDFE